MYVVRMMQSNGNVRFLEDESSPDWTSNIDKAIKFDTFEDAHYCANQFIGGFAEEV